MMHKFLNFIFLSILFFSTHVHALPTQCLDKAFTLQVLGSGGPIPEGRASSGYLVWWEGKARFLIDSGGGVFLRFAQAGANIEDLDLIALSHFHTDHSADFPAILKGGYFSSRTRPLKVTGPSASEPFPGLHQYLHRMLSAKEGAYAYLNGFLAGTGGLFKLDPQEVNAADTNTPVIIYQDKDITISALSIPHGIVPALAHRIDTPAGRVVISSDQNGHNPAFIEFSKNADVLVMPMAIPEDSSKGDKELHVPPDLVGKIANKSNAQLLVLTHFMGPTLRFAGESIEIIKTAYKGPVFAARDLECFPISNQKGEVHE
jgi:ribonuclease BN (tRNA processing enzyme)